MEEVKLTNANACLQNLDDAHHHARSLGSPLITYLIGMALEEVATFNDRLLSEEQDTTRAAA